jgi:hypothetical protein
MLSLLSQELPYKATQALIVNALHARFGHGSCAFINGDERLEGVLDPSGRLVALSLDREAAARHRLGLRLRP